MCENRNHVPKPEEYCPRLKPRHAGRKRKRKIKIGKRIESKRKMKRRI